MWMQKTFLALVFSALKWGKQHKAKWADYIMSCGIREDADLQRGLWLLCCWPAGTHPAQVSLMCLAFRTREETCAYALSNTYFPFISFKLVCICSHVFHMGLKKLVIYIDYRVLYYVFKGSKMLYVKPSIQSLAKIVQTNVKICKLYLNGWDVEARIPWRASKWNWGT